MPVTGGRPRSAELAAWARLGGHLATAAVFQVALVVYVTRSDALRGTWLGSLLCASVVLYAGLGVSIFKESIPGLRHEKGDIRDEPRILGASRDAASRDCGIAAALLAVALLLGGWPVDAALALWALLAGAFTDFWVRQLLLRRGEIARATREDQASMR